MRLLQLNTYHYRRGGSDVVFLEHDRLFREHGWETAVLAMRHPSNEPSPWEEYFVDEIELGRRYPLHRRALMAAKVVYSWEARAKLRRLLRVFRPDVVHAHCIYHHLSPSVLPLLSEEGIPVVLTAHDLKLACPAYKMLNRGGVCERCRDGNLLNVVRYRCVHGSLALSALIALESAVHRALGLYRQHLARVVVPSRFFADKLAEWGWPRERLAYIPNWVAAAAFPPSYRPGDYFLYVGRLAEEKGVRTLLRAAALAAVPVRVVGAGPDGASLRAAVGPGQDVRFLGYRSGEELWREVGGARAVVMPSEWYENAPMAVLEAYACGKPVVGARIGGVPELVPSAEVGRLFASGDAESLACCLEELAGLPDAAVEAMGRAGRRFVEETFTRDRYWESMAALYAGLLGAGSNRAAAVGG